MLMLLHVAAGCCVLRRDRLDGLLTTASSKGDKEIGQEARRATGCICIFASNSVVYPTTTTTMYTCPEIADLKLAQPRKAEADRRQIGK